MFRMHVVTSEGEKKDIINLTIHFKGDDGSLQGELQLWESFINMVVGV